MFIVYIGDILNFCCAEKGYQKLRRRRKELWELSWGKVLDSKESDIDESKIILLFKYSRKQPFCLIISIANKYTEVLSNVVEIPSSIFSVSSSPLPVQASFPVVECRL